MLRIKLANNNSSFDINFKFALQTKYVRMNIPENLKYTKDHEWVSIEGDVATVGITDFAQGELGDIVYVEIETEGESLDNEEIFGSVEAVKNSIRFIYAFKWRNHQIQR